MAAAAYNCPFTAVKGSPSTALKCSEVRAINTDAGCAFYNAAHDHCAFAEVMLGEAREFGTPQNPGA